MAKKPKRARTVRREVEQKRVRDGDRGDQLFLREPGGTPGHPIDVDSAAVVELRARAVPCPRCGGEHALLEHTATTHEGHRLREVRLQCRGCAALRSLWLRLPVLN